jgi:hypothetical protein
MLNNGRRLLVGAQLQRFLGDAGQRCYRAHPRTTNQKPNNPDLKLKASLDPLSGMLFKI